MVASKWAAASSTFFGRRCRGAVWSESGVHCLTSAFPITAGHPGSVVNCVRNLRGSFCWVQVGHVAEDGIVIGVKVGIELVLEVDACVLEHDVVRFGLAAPPGRLGVVACRDESCRVVAHQRKASSLRGRWDCRGRSLQELDKLGLSLAVWDGRQGMVGGWSPGDGRVVTIFY